MNKNTAYPVLVIDDEETIRRLLTKELGNENREVMAAATGEEAMAMIRSNWFDVIVMDLLLPDVSDLDLLIRVKEAVPHVEIIMITGHGDIDTAVEAMKLGAYDFIRKPFNLDRLDLMVEKAHQRVQLQRENAILRHRTTSEKEVKFIGNSRAVRDIKFLIDKVAPEKIPVLITGESGSGKDVVARLIHERSSCSDKPMIIKNCATLQKELARSELFGHVKGSFTGGTENREGLLAFAHNSTLFLDEIGDLPIDVQASLLRALETQTYRRVGEKEERCVNIRFLFATNKNLADEVSRGQFNEALFHRINAFHIQMPPIHERREDLPLLVDYFLTTLHPDKPTCRIVKDAMDCMMRYSWPGNVRELRNVIERSIILSENNIITERCMPKEIAAGTEDNEDSFSLEDAEKKHVLKVLDFYSGNRRKTAEALGIGRKTLYRKLSSYLM
ncbi:sigma-54-dependent transcriptional regulator [Desulfopila inferna]|uniref:sigma-54-dependent transcriptional regulator n=1 Tax=Desulfopila inferna TaxID=468528 RepID=UPI001963446C|nr:sigma-54 dependent transcriptional regulator [Desulfopila inferna]MBM9603632.1 sigma-54-dependent Fis family transcriptional regulator [Desulfopila inferna]